MQFRTPSPSESPKSTPFPQIPNTISLNPIKHQQIKPELNKKRTKQPESKRARKRKRVFTSEIEAARFRDRGERERERQGKVKTEEFQIRNEKNEVFLYDNII